MSTFHSGIRLREAATDEFTERVIAVERVSRVVAGGRRMRFRVVILVGNYQGLVGVGIGKSHEYQDAHRKASSAARRRLTSVFSGPTIPKMIQTKVASSQVLLKPAPLGTSLIAGSVVRAVCELAGIRNIVAKQLGNTNRLNTLRATIQALAELNARPQ